ncbi:unnamed protein product [Sphenostylis stenocarpa]|uniref:Uncharacterized protein n=1 Tax=Sphenostylis stenocarpa TaxID=92480 RepID=A0AA86RR03_9FABA|nr:unnamed protein product [Sphenostylis stenocarpa]
MFILLGSGLASCWSISGVVYVGLYISRNLSFELGGCVVHSYFQPRIAQVIREKGGWVRSHRFILEYKPMMLPDMGTELVMS